MPKRTRKHVVRRSGRRRTIIDALGRVAKTGGTRVSTTRLSELIRSDKRSSTPATILNSCQIATALIGMKNTRIGLFL